MWTDTRLWRSVNGTTTETMGASGCVPSAGPRKSGSCWSLLIGKTVTTAGTVTKLLGGGEGGGEVGPPEPGPLLGAVLAIENVNSELDVEGSAASAAPPADVFVSCWNSRTA